MRVEFILPLLGLGSFLLCGFVGGRFRRGWRFVAGGGAIGLRRLVLGAVLRGGGRTGLADHREFIFGGQIVIVKNFGASLGRSAVLFCLAGIVAERRSGLALCVGRLARRISLRQRRESEQAQQQ